MLKRLLVTLFLFNSTLLFASQKNLSLQDHKSEAQFKKITNDIANLYESEIKELNVIFSTRLNWHEDSPNASALKIENSWSINFNGGLYREAQITNDAYALSVCHEIGHLIGGAPFNSSNLTHETSVEGQSDFWASTVCIKNYFSHFPDQDYRPSKEAQKICNPRQNFTATEKTNCMRTIDAGISLASFLSKSEKNKKINYFQIDSAISSFTKKEHPNAQCRFDTIKIGALCELENVKMTKTTFLSRELSDLNCKISNKAEFSNVRANCWFNSDINNLIINVTKVSKKNSWGKVSIVFSNHESAKYDFSINLEKDGAQYLELQINHDSVTLKENAKDQIVLFNFKTLKKIKNPINAHLEIRKDGIVIQKLKLLLTN